VQIDAKGMYYRDLNQLILKAAESGEEELILNNVNGQRYIASNLDKKLRIVINGVPGNDLAAFMNGSEIIVNANGQDAIGNTMNDGLIVVHGHAGDTVGYGMRNGKIYVRDNVGYRVGIHMKEYQDSVPVLIIGGTAGRFLGEYMAGGILIVLGLNRKSNEPLTGDYLGTGMHGGVIYLREKPEKDILGKEVAVFDADDNDYAKIMPFLEEYCEYFNYDVQEILKQPFYKLLPVSKRPYGRLYAY
jgi:glutamate synthase domain-containing protein 3